ncbi:MAG TPA: SusC/RagA family TonB-linked outer membrane protein [Puia sp.]|nr:SusC/RagA family TonB-linked outer membrane protein [Puia sp.]
MTIQRLLARTVSLVFICVLFTQLAFSQTKTVTGKITDDKGAPVAGASVTVKGSKSGSASHQDGSFIINVPANATTLVVSSVGYTQQEVSIGDGNGIAVSLVPSTTGLNEVVVIGYGTTVRKDVTGSIATVRAKDFNKGVTTPEELLIGKVAGLQIANNSGQPGGTTITKIRGNNSIVSGNNPLYVVDGVPLDATSPIPGNKSAGVGTSPLNNPLLFLNPGDILQIDVLKDASSAAIYGSRGENGVVLITTNKGTGKSQIDAAVTTTFPTGLMKKADILSASQYRSEIAKYGFKSDSGLSIDPFSQIIRHKPSVRYAVAIQGGNENGKYRASFAANDDQGIILKSGLTQYNANFSGEHYAINRRLRLNVNVIASHYNLQSAPISNDAGSTGNLISAAMNWNPTLRLVNPDGTFMQSNPSGQINPLALSAYTNDNSSVTQILGNAGISFQIFPFLTYNFLYGLDYGIATRDAELQGLIAATGSNADGKGSAAQADGSIFSQTITHTLTFDKKVTTDLNLKVLAGYEYWSTTGLDDKGSFTYGFNWNVPGGPYYPNLHYYDNMSAGNQANLTAFSDFPPTTNLQSYFGRVELGFAEKYYLTATMRADGSSKFGANNRYAYFPSFGFRWNIMNEDFMKNNTVFSNLALRVGYGQTGGQDGLSSSAAQQLGFFSGFNPAANGNQNPRIGTINFSSPNLKWETLTSYDGGIDFGFLNDRIVGYVDVFSKKTTNPLFPGTLSVPSQGATIWQNLPGYITNKGFEFSINIAAVRTKDFSWNIGGNVEFVKNKFIYPALGGSPLYLTGGVDGQGVSSAFAQALANGQPIDVFYLRQFEGFDQNGIAIVKSQASAYSGDPNPSVILGINTDLTYKKFSLAINTHGQMGNKIFNNTLVSVTNLGNIANGKNISKTLIGTKESLANPVSASTRFLQSGNFLKIGNVTLTYNIGKVSNVVKASHAFITVYNLYEFTKYTGFDAEVNQDHNNNGIPSLGMDYIGYPTSRSIAVGLNFTL